MKDKHRLLIKLGFLSVLALMFVLVYASLRQAQTGTELALLLQSTLACIAVVFCLLLARTMIQHVSAKNRQLNYRSSHDTLTGLINRSEFETRVERAIRHAQTQSVTHALLHIDVDRFKSVNDSYGHSTGDQLLQELGQLLLTSVRKRDTLSRLGGDEFGMLLEICPLDKAVQIAQSLLEAIGSFHFTRADKSFKQGISIGVVPIDRDTTDSAAAMSAADSACSLVKQSDHSKIQIAHLGNQRLQARHGQMQWLTRLTNAFVENRFTLYFQPIVPCASTARHEKHVEILLRMIDDDGSIIAPGIFLAVAEKYNLASNLDRWVIEHAMAWLAKVSASSHWPIRITINLSAQSILNQSMVKYIIDQAGLSGIEPKQVCFEITETAVIANLTAATSFMLTLRGCGFKFSLDDFGSGLASFAYMKKIPVDYLKIDGAFVRDILFDPVDRTMVKAINELGHLLGKETIAKYVETLDVVDELKNMGIDYVQGYVYSQPQSIDDFAHIMGPHLVVVPSETSRQAIA